MEELKQAFYEVMYKYEKAFSEAGVMANLNEWAKNKAPLLELLRRHPGWDEAAKAIVFHYDEGRGIEPDTIDEAAFTLEDLAMEQIKAEQDKEKFRTAFRAAIVEHNNTLSEEALEIIRTHGGIKCAAGQKASRIIGKLCRQFRVDGHSRYNAVFAQLSDALNPLQMPKTALLSVHPCDFLEMSNKDNTWISCHNLTNGSYQTGALSYMTDDVSMIFYTVDNGVADHFYRVPRHSRQMFFYKDNMLYQSRLYPADSSEPMDQYRNLVQKAMSLCLGQPNLWKLITKRDELDNYCESAEGSRQYPDYNYHGNVSLLKSADHYGHFVIGAPSLCVCCGLPYNTGWLKCGCPETVVCKDCGQTIAKQDARYIDGAYHCRACLHICAVCGHTTNETMYPAVDRHGNMVEICRSCYEASLEPCAACSVQNVCRIIGNRFCQRVSVSVQAGGAAQ